MAGERTPADVSRSLRSVMACQHGSDGRGIADAGALAYDSCGWEGDMMTSSRKALRRIGWVILLCMVAVNPLVWAQDPASASVDEGANLSESRALGVGIQVDFPWGG